MAGVAQQAAFQTGTRNDHIRVTGTDKLYGEDNVPQKHRGEVLLAIRINPASFPRLSRMASTFQKYRFLRMDFRIVSMASTSTSGGYIIGFIPDPDDLADTWTTEQLLSTPHCRIVKAWESATIGATLESKWLYTNTGMESRLYSPGIFVIMVEGSIPGTAPLSVYVDWVAEMHTPSLELVSKPVQQIEVVKNAYLRDAHFGLWFSDAEGGDDPHTIVPGIVYDVVYKLQSRVYVDYTDQAGSYDKIVATTGDSHGPTLWVADFKGRRIEKEPVKNTFVLEKGDVLTPVQGEVRRGTSCFPRSPLPSSQDGWELLQKDLRNLSIEGSSK